MPKTAITLSDVKEAQPHWFTPENKRFFNDVSYKVLHGKASHKPFLVRATYAWESAGSNWYSGSAAQNFDGLQFGHHDAARFETRHRCGATNFLAGL